jgi:long-chain acyl-CoA synthetase
LQEQKRRWLSHYDDTVPADLGAELEPLTAVFQRTAQRFPDNIALVFMNRRISYRELEHEVALFAVALAELGVRKGTKVAIHLPNLPQSVIAYYATLTLGAHAVLTNPLYVEREIEHQWHDAGCRVAIVADYLFEQRIRAIRDKLPIEHFVVTSIPEYMRFPLNWLARLKLAGNRPPLTARVVQDKGVHFMRDLIKRASGKPEPVDIDLEDIAILQYTGGTTGVSKGAMLTHRNLSTNVEQVRAWFTTMEFGREVVLSCLPFFHVFGMTVGMNFPLAIGAAMVLMPDPRDIPRIIGNIAKQRVTLFPAVPAMFNAINNYPGIDDLDLTSVKACISGSAPLPQDVGKRFEALSHSIILEGFGLTETSPVTHCNPLGGTRKNGSIGIPLPSTEAKVVSVENGTDELEPGNEGELLIRGPQVMKGYWNRPEETALAMAGEWLRTGDIARMDEDGYFFIVGRKKDIIIAGGYKIYPDEVDEVLVAHPAVLEAATVGVPDRKRGETVKSFVVLAEGQSVTAEELEAHCRKELAAYKVPRQFEFRESLPKSGALKVLRRELRDEAVSQQAAST